MERYRAYADTRSVDGAAATQVIGPDDDVEVMRVSPLDTVGGGQNRALPDEYPGAELSLVRVVRQRVVKNQHSHRGDWMPDITSSGRGCLLAGDEGGHEHDGEQARQNRGHCTTRASRRCHGLCGAALLRRAQGDVDPAAGE
jgi:hypothetical protein